MSEVVTPGTLPAAWRGIAEWTYEDGVWWPWRLSRRELATCAAPRLTDRARMPAGGRLAVTTDATALAVDTVGDPRQDGCLDVVVDGALTHSLVVPARLTTSQVSLAPGEKVVELWLPHATHAGVREVRLAGDHVAPAPAGARWVAYGSSITHCRGVPTPTRTWPALVSRALGWELTALGMAGECHLDPAVARTIAATRADVVFLCVGANIHGKATFSARSLPSALTGFLATVRGEHPATPVVVMTPIVAPDREQRVNEVGLTLSAVRELVAETVGALADPAVHLVDGRTILSPDEAHLLADGLHPTPAGYELMAARLEPILGALHP